MADKPFRLLPRITPENEHFWTGGSQGRLQFLRCRPCGHWIHPPSPVCPVCLSRELSVEAVSGNGSVFTYTVNHQPWNPTVPVPYVIAIVVLDEQDDLRLTTNIVDCAPDDVRIGMRVRVTFDQHRDVFVPVFAPA